MTISDKLYIGPSLKRREQRVLKKIAQGKPALCLYVITNAWNSKDLFDVYYYNELFQRFYQVYRDLTIYGVAKTKWEAYELIERMVNDCVAKQNDLDLRRFLQMKQEDI